MGLFFKSRIPALYPLQNRVWAGSGAVRTEDDLIALHALDKGVQAGIEGGGVFAVGEVT